MATFRGGSREALSETDLTVLAAGPWAAGLELRAPAVRHDRLRRLWTQHARAVRAEAARRGLAEPWFLDRDRFVRDLRGEK